MVGKWCFGQLPTLFRMWSQPRAPTPFPTCFSPITSANVGIIHPKNLTFSFNPYATLVQNPKAISSASPKLLNLNKDHPSKNGLSGQGIKYYILYIL